MRIFGGIDIHPNPLMVEKKVMRVPGGYLNRWLIRAEVTVPSSNVIHDRINNRMYCHPAMMERIRQAIPATKQSRHRSDPSHEHRRA